MEARRAGLKEERLVVVHRLIKIKVEIQLVERRRKIGRRHQSRGRRDRRQVRCVVGSRGKRRKWLWRGDNRRIQIEEAQHLFYVLRRQLQ